MKTRIITAAIAAAIAIAIIVLGEFFPWVIIGAICIVTAMIVFEYLTAKKLHTDIPIMVLSLLFAVSSVALSCTSFWFVPLYAYTVLLFVFHLFRYKKRPVTDVMFAYGGTVIIGLAMMCLSRLSCLQGVYTSFYIILALACPWLADSAAYFTGSALGKHKLCPGISPKKTVEGAIGGALGSVVGSMLVGLVFQFIVYRNVIVNFPVLLVIGVYCAVVSVFGDLVFSLIKRECKIKDYGSIMPGHGGMLDRFDSVIFTVPFILFMSYSFGLIFLV